MPQLCLLLLALLLLCLHYLPCSSPSLCSPCPSPSPCSPFPSPSSCSPCPSPSPCSPCPSPSPCPLLRACVFALGPPWGCVPWYPAGLFPCFFQVFFRHHILGEAFSDNLVKLQPFYSSSCFVFLLIDESTYSLISSSFSYPTGR